MKCVCGYENKHGEMNFETMEKFQEPKKDKFTKIEGHLYVKGIDDHWNENIFEIELYICPKCKTVQANEFF